jgi:hypothetical protein
MSTWIVVHGVKPYDGRYELDLEQEFTTREWGWIKRLAGYLPADMTDSSFTDPEFICVLAAVAMRRAGRIQPIEVPDVFGRLIDAPFTEAITAQTDDDQEEPPVDPTASSSLNGSTSGAGSPTSSGPSAPPPSPIGIRGSDISASAPPTLAS